MAVLFGDRGQRDRDDAGDLCAAFGGDAGVTVAEEGELGPVGRLAAGEDVVDLRAGRTVVAVVPGAVGPSCSLNSILTMDPAGPSTSISGMAAQFWPKSWMVAGPSDHVVTAVMGGRALIPAVSIGTRRGETG